MHAAVFLDRDNTVIRNDGDLGDPEQVVLMQGAASAVASLKGLGYRIIVVTNQGGVARGKYGVEDVEKVHAKINELIHANSNVKIDDFYYCPYHPQGTVEKYRQEHPWRKPQPGMLLHAAKELQLDLSQSWLIGDQMRDVEAGAAAGVRTILLAADAPVLPPLAVDQARALAAAEAGTEVQPDFYARNMIEAVRVIAQQRRPERIMEEEWEKPAAARLPVTVRTRTATSQPSSPPSRTEAKPTTPVSARPARPFRPWDAPPDEEEPQRRVPRHRPGESARASGPAAEAPPAPLFETPPAPPAPAAKPAPEPEPEPEPEPKFEPTPPPAPAPAMETRAEETPVVDDADILPPGSSRQDRLLRQILQELKGQRAMREDFSYLRMFATVLQVLAGVCLLAGLLLGSGDIVMFLRWIAVAILVQLATLAMLLFDR